MTGYELGLNKTAGLVDTATKILGPKVTRVVTKVGKPAAVLGLGGVGLYKGQNAFDAKVKDANLRARYRAYIGQNPELVESLSKEAGWQSSLFGGVKSMFSRGGARVSSSAKRATLPNVRKLAPFPTNTGFSDWAAKAPVMRGARVVPQARVAANSTRAINGTLLPKGSYTPPPIAPKPTINPVTTAPKINPVVTAPTAAPQAATGMHGNVVTPAAAPKAATGGFRNWISSKFSRPPKNATPKINLSTNGIPKVEPKINMTGQTGTIPGGIPSAAKPSSFNMKPGFGTGLTAGLGAWGLHSAYKANDAKTDPYNQ